MKLYCLLFIISSVWPAWGQQAGACSGGFDFFFAVDSSVSVGDDYEGSVVPFVRDVSSNFINPNFRLCFVTFSFGAELHMPLTPAEETGAIADGIESLYDTELDYGTDLFSALDIISRQITEDGGDAARVMLVITDGSFTGSFYQRIERLKGLGVQRFVIGIADDFSMEQLLSVVDSEDDLFLGNNYQYLQEIIERVIERTCVEITSINPSRLCVDRNSTDVTLMGRGFTINLDRNRAACRFRVGSEEIVTDPVGRIENNRIVCRDPGMNATGQVEVQVTLDGSTYVTSSVQLEVSLCEPDDDYDDDDDDDNDDGGGVKEDGGGGGGGVNVGLIVGIILGLLGLILVLLCCLLWLCFPIITCKIVGGLPPEPEEKVPEPKPGRKWEVVDASYYGGGGIGGIKPVTVRWGKSGSTEEGNKLTKAKDAEVVEVVEEPGEPAPPPKDPPGCWERFKKKVRRMYAVASSYRPVWGPTKRILWFPGTKPDGKTKPPPSAKTRTPPAPLRAGSSTAFLLSTIDGNVESPVRSPPPPSSTRAPPPPPPPPSSTGAPPPPPPSSTRAPPPPPPPPSSTRAPPPPPPSTATARAPLPRPTPYTKPPVPSRPSAKTLNT